LKAVFLDFGSLGPGDVDAGPLRRVVPDLTAFADTAPGEVAARIASADVVLGNKVCLDESALRDAPRLKLICLAATGTDNVDLAAARARGIAVCNIRNYCTPSVTQHVFALMLALNQHLGEYDRLVRAGAWTQGQGFCLLEPTFAELAGRTLGIVGLGNLGQAVARVAQAFGMEVLAAKRPYRDPGGNRGRPLGNGVQRVDFAELLARSHVVSLHCPLNEETRHLIDATALAQMRRDALLINTARGALIDAAALVAALREGRIAGAGIDVLDREPPPADHPLLSARLPNLIVTPHMAWAAREARQRALAEMAENIADFLRGGQRNRVA
jgi:glycerate dehydrogenase